VVASMLDKVKRSNASRDFKFLVNIALIIKMLDVLEEKNELFRYLGSHFILLSKRISLLLGRIQ